MPSKEEELLEAYRQGSNDTFPPVAVIAFTAGMVCTGLIWALCTIFWP